MLIQNASDAKRWVAAWKGEPGAQSYSKLAIRGLKMSKSIMLSYPGRYTEEEITDLGEAIATLEGCQKNL